MAPPSSMSDTIAAITSDLQRLRAQIEIAWPAYSSSIIVVPIDSTRRLFGVLNKIAQRALPTTFLSSIPPHVSCRLVTDTLVRVYDDLYQALLDIVQDGIDYVKIEINLLFLRNWRYEDFDLVKLIDLSAISQIIVRLAQVGPSCIAVAGSSKLVLTIGILGIGIGVVAWAKSNRSRVATSEQQMMHDDHLPQTLAFDQPELLIRRAHRGQVRFAPPSYPLRPRRANAPLPHHELILRYIYPTTSIWPPTYLQAFDRASKSSRNLVGVMTHIDTKPSANTRSKGKETAERWNGKVVLSRKAVMDDLKEGRIGLREEVVLGEEEGESAWKGVEWID